MKFWYLLLASVNVSSNSQGISMFHQDNGFLNHRHFLNNSLKYISKKSIRYNITSFPAWVIFNNNRVVFTLRNYTCYFCPWILSQKKKLELTPNRHHGFLLLTRNRVIFARVNFGTNYKKEQKCSDTCHKKALSWTVVMPIPSPYEPKLPPPKTNVVF